MSQQQSVAGSDVTAAVQPELDVGQQVRVLSGKYRGSVGHVTDIEWRNEAGEWFYVVHNEKVYYGIYSAKELW